MKILKLPPYYRPERISSSHLTDDLEEAYVNAGFELCVYAPTPTRGVSQEVYNEYKNREYEELRGGKIKVHRFKMCREGRDPIGRAWRYFRVHWKQYRKAIKEPGVDVISAGSTPPTQGILCALVKKKLTKRYKRPVKLVFSLHDVFPDSLVNAGMTKKGSLVWKVGRKIENFTYKNADKIIVISKDIKQNILAKGVPEEKIELVYNWVDTQSVCPVPKAENPLFEEFGLSKSDFNVVYAGNLGKAQGIGAVVKAAELMKDRQNVKFVIFGNGAEEANIRADIEQKGLENVVLLPLQPAERVSTVYSLGDACIVSCKKGNGVNAFPSKTVSIMATATPVLAFFDEESELCEIVKGEAIGACAEPENPEALVSAIEALLANPQRLEEMGKRARALAEARFSKQACTKEYVRIIGELCQ